MPLNGTVFTDSDVAALADQLRDFETRADALSKLQTKVYAEEDACVEILSQLRKKCRTLGKSEEAERVKERLLSMEARFPRKPLLVLRLALGSKANFLLRQTEKLKYKADYENFKFTVNTVALIAMLLNYFFINHKLLDSFLLFLMLYSYSTITLREHILRVNGSRIRSWWLFHHYFSIALSGVMLIWPYSTSYNIFRTHFLPFGIYTAVVQIMQFRYQTQRLYTLRSLSKATQMDVTNDMGGGFGILLAALLAGQLWQFYNAWILFQITQRPDTEEWEPYALCAIFALMSVGNFVTTLIATFSKVRKQVE